MNQSLNVKHNSIGIIAKAKKRVQYEDLIHAFLKHLMAFLWYNFKQTEKAKADIKPIIHC